MPDGGVVHRQKPERLVIENPYCLWIVLKHQAILTFRFFQLFSSLVPLCDIAEHQNYACNRPSLVPNGCGAVVDRTDTAKSSDEESIFPKAGAWTFPQYRVHRIFDSSFGRFINNTKHLLEFETHRLARCPPSQLRSDGIQ